MLESGTRYFHDIGVEFQSSGRGTFSGTQGGSSNRETRSLLRAIAILAALIFCPIAVAADVRQVAITIDDLPRGGDGGPTDLANIRAMTTKLMQPFKAQQIPVTGFVNAGRWKGDEAGLREILDIWLDAGADLGNHSWSHPDINSVPLDAYMADVIKGEPAIRAALGPRGKQLQFYRHPYLHTGPTPQIKSDMQAALDKLGYRVAPVTLDDADYMFAAAYTQPKFRERARAEYIPYMESIVAFFEQRSVEVTGHEVAQILLIHANQLNADLMPELLEMFRRRGYTFVTLEQAMKDPAYQLPESYAGRNGFSWIHRWSVTRGMTPRGEPEPAEWVRKAFEER